jgi:hypothetical protein
MCMDVGGGHPRHRARRISKSPRAGPLISVRIVIVHMYRELSKACSMSSKR